MEGLHERQVRDLYGKRTRRCILCNTQVLHLKAQAKFLRDICPRVSLGVSSVAPPVGCSVGKPKGGSVADARNALGV